jgi:ATP-dependent RNA helicase RhlE
MTIGFSDLSLRSEIQNALTSQGYERPTPIQAETIPHALAGRDVLGIAQTGTGKTAAFALPILERLARSSARALPGNARALILTPTRELALQIAENFDGYGANLGLRSAVIFGGVAQRPQVAAMRRGVDILVACPGRLLDLMSQGHVRFDRLEILVLDEADRMLDMGFVRDVRKIIAALPRERQTFFFSATMPGEVDELAGSLLRAPVRVEVTPAATTVERIEQRVLFVEAKDKRRLLLDLLADERMSRVIVFTRTKRGADKVAAHLEAARIPAAAIHGDKPQPQRETALAGFRAGTVRILVATDIAARGIDVDGVTHVVNFELPNVPESYVHRIGRTARAGAEGVVISFCDRAERAYLRDIEKLTRTPLAAAGTERAAPSAPKPAAVTPAVRRPPRSASAGAPVARPTPVRQDQAAAEATARRRPAMAFGDLVAAINR